MSDVFSTKIYDFDLPADLIAQDPPERRGDSRLLLVEPDVGVVAERVFRQLPEVLRAGDLLVLNESRVLPARLLTTRMDTGGKVEILLVRPAAVERTWLALARPGRRLREGTKLMIGEVNSGSAEHGPMLEVIERLDQGQFLVSADSDPGLLAEKWGVMPLPPYIKRDHQDLVSERGRRDRDRYQTVYAVDDRSGAGSVAAPTAGLHFSEDILETLAVAGVGIARVSLHVGPGTFREPTEEQVAARRLHREFFHLPAETAALIAETRRTGGRVIAVGTTSLRVLETVARLNLPDGGPCRLEYHAADGAEVPEFRGEAERHQGFWEVSGETRLFLRPPDRVTSVDGLLTNFHLPASSLLMLVAALMGENTWLGVYAQAVASRLRFYSYGDCMLILPGLSGPAAMKGF
jgi:S-adenosylmethionine:tRNA ribosyltransferase-isomerase